MAVGPAAGSRFYIGTTASVALTDAYTEVGNVTNLPEFGRIYDSINFSSLGNRNVIKFKGQRDDGTIGLDLGRSPADAGQTALRVALDSDFDYNFKLTLNDDITPPESAVVTISIATPGVVTWTGHGLSAGAPVSFVTTGALPTGITAGTTYYVLAAGLTTNAFEIGATAGGSAINTSGTQSGVHTATATPGLPTTFYFKGKVMSYTTNVGGPNAVVASRASIGITSGSITELAAA